MEEKRTIRTRRIGAVTFGIILIIYGVLFLFRMIFPALSYEVIFRMWPMVFISLGVEILVGSRKPGERFVYDGASVFLLILLVTFAMAMAGMDWIFSHYSGYPGYVFF